MPVYNFKCISCECITTKTQKFEDSAPPCKKCDAETKRTLSKSSFVLKGKGWFKTGGY